MTIPLGGPLILEFLHGITACCDMLLRLISAFSRQRQWHIGISP